MKISIENPCHENWDAMQPNNDGAYCLACQKSVIDFSRKTTQEIKSFFKSITANEKVCGRFKSQQLKELSFDDFFEKFKRLILPRKIAIILFFTFGLGLYSCQSHREDHMPVGEITVSDLKKDTTQKNDSIAITEDKIEMGEPIATETLTPIPTKQNNNKAPLFLKGDVNTHSDTSKKDRTTKKEKHIVGEIE